MAIKDRDTLKNYFLTGYKPTQSQFENLIDSAVNGTDDKASVAEAELGTDDVKFITPKTAKAVAVKYTPDASETVKGIIEIATLEEVEAAENKPLAVTPLGIKKAAEFFAPVKKVNNISPVSGNITITDITGTAGTITGNITKSQVTGLDSDLLPKIIGMPKDDMNITDSTSEQNVLYSINLSANKSYHFRGRLIVTKGTTGSVIKLGWGVGTSGAISSIEYISEAFSVSGSNSLTSATQRVQINTIDATIVNTSNTNSMNVIDFDGILRCSASTTFFPQITFTIATGGTSNKIRTGSFMEFFELGSDVVEKIGAVN